MADAPNTEKKYAAFAFTFTDPWEGVDVELNFRFSKPTKTMIKRLQSTAGKDPAQAARNLLLDTVHPDEKDELIVKMDQYPGISTSYSTVLIRSVGISTDLGN